MEYKKSRQNAKRVISSAKEKKQKEWANDLNDSECQNKIFRMAKQMVKERQDITGLNCIKGASGKVIVDERGRDGDPERPSCKYPASMIKGSKTLGRSTWRN